MSTNCRIGKMEKDGTIRAIYVHWDGYPSYVGKILTNNYTDENQIDKLLDLGNLSSLGEEPISNKEMCNYHCRVKSDYKGCVSYKDMGYDDTDSIIYSNEFDYIRNGFEEYMYLFKNRKWNYIKLNTEFKLLTKEDTKE